MQNSVLSTRITSRYWVPAFTYDFVHAKQHLKDQTNRSEWVTELIFGFVHAKLRAYHWTYKSLWDPDLACGFFAFKTGNLAPEIQVSMRPSPHLWFCAFTTALL